MYPCAHRLFLSRVLPREQTDTAATSAPRILYYGGCWPTNIGNAFIDIGAMALLQAAVPGASIHIASEGPRWFFASWRQPEPRRFGPFSWRPSDSLRPGPDKAFDLAEHTVCDLVVFSGMAMCEEFVRVNGPAILALRQRGAPVLLLGTGGALYTAQEKAAFAAFLQKVRPVAFVSRDQTSYDAYHEYVTNSFSGIDCGFFVSLGYRPPPLDLPPFVALNFDTTPEPQLPLDGYRVIRTHHSCWGPVSRELASIADTLVSDLPQDYLATYAHAACVYSDRVHACVAALSYGRKAQLFHPTPRGGLFDAIGAATIREKPIALAPDYLEAKRRQQIDLVAGLVSTTLGIAAVTTSSATPSVTCTPCGNTCGSLGPPRRLCPLPNGASSGWYSTRPTTAASVFTQRLRLVTLRSPDTSSRRY